MGMNRGAQDIESCRVEYRIIWMRHATDLLPT